MLLATPETAGTLPIPLYHANEWKYVGELKHPASVIMLGIVGWRSKAFSSSEIKRMLTVAEYKKLIICGVIPKLNSTNGVRNWVWVEEGVPADTA